MVQKVSKINTYLKATVSKVEEDKNLIRNGNKKWSSGHSVTEDATVCSVSFERRKQQHNKFRPVCEAYRLVYSPYYYGRKPACFVTFQT